MPYLSIQKEKEANCWLTLAGQMVAKPHEEGKWNDVSVWLGHLKHSQQTKTLPQHNEQHNGASQSKRLWMSIFSPHLIDRGGWIWDRKPVVMTKFICTPATQTRERKTKRSRTHHSLIVLLDSWLHFRWSKHEENGTWQWNHSYGSSLETWQVLHQLSDYVTKLWWITRVDNHRRTLFFFRFLTDILAHLK